MTDRTRRRAAAWFWLGLFALTLSATPFLAPASTRAATASVAVENYDFAPSSRTITAGDTVRWAFSGDQHSVTSRDGLFDSGIKDAGGSFQFRFTKAGTFRYYCVVHPDLMSGTVVVRAAAATPKPTVRPTPNPTPKPTPRASARPTPTPIPPTQRTASPSTSPSPAASLAPTDSPAASEALVESPGPSAVPPSAAPAPEPPAPANDTTPIVAAGVVLVAVALVGGLLVARQRRSI